MAIALITLPLTWPIYRWEYAATNGKTIIWAPVTLFLGFTLLLPKWLSHIHQVRHPWQTLGMTGGSSWLRHWLTAFTTGMTGVCALYGLQLALGWGAWVSPEGNVIRNLAEGVLVGVGVGLAEELIFRGWLLFELEQTYSAPLSLVVDAGIFAIAHYLRPLSEIFATWPQFTGLFLLGMSLVWARRIPIRQRRTSTTQTTLAPAAGLHGGLVFAYYQVDVNDLFVSTNQVPEWVTGIAGNPLAGMLGLIFLSMIGYGTYTLSHSAERPLAKGDR